MLFMNNIICVVYIERDYLVLLMKEIKNSFVMDP